MVAGPERVTGPNYDLEAAGLAVALPWRHDEKTLAETEGSEPPLPHRRPARVLERQHLRHRTVDQHSGRSQHGLQPFNRHRAYALEVGAKQYCGLLAGDAGKFADIASEGAVGDEDSRSLIDHFVGHLESH